MTGVRIQFRRDLAANWTSNNPTLMSGELGIETDTKAFKLGDGTTAWNDLVYSSLPVGGLTAQILRKASDDDYDFEWASAGAGDVVGSTSSVDENIVVFDGVTGKLIKDSGIKLDDKEDSLGNPITDDFILSSKTDGTRNWVEMSEGSDEKVKYDSEDPTAGYIADKFIAGDGISVAEGTAENENKLVISNTDKGSDVDLSSYAIEEDVMKYAGFENRTDSSIGMSGNNFQITTASNYNIYINGSGKQTINSTLSVEITADQTITFVYLDMDGENVRINASTTPWDIKTGTAIPLAIVFKDGANYAVTDERHSYNRNLEWHNWAHNNIGAMYFNGLAGTFTDTTLSIAQGTIYDEDIRFDTGETKTTTSLWYRNATDGMRIIRNSTTPYATVDMSGTPGLAYDNNGTLTSVGGNAYAVNWIFASNDSTEPIYTVVSQQSYVSLFQARNATLPTINLSTAEWKLLYRVIFQRTTPGGTETISFIEASDFRNVQTGVPVTALSPTSHSILTDRDATSSHPATAISADDLASNPSDVQSELDKKLENITGESIGDLSDVDLTGISDNKLLKWDTDKFVIDAAPEYKTEAEMNTLLDSDTDISNRLFMVLGSEALEFVSAETSVDGTYIDVTMSKNIEESTLSGRAGDFTFTEDEAPRTFDAIAIEGADVIRLTVEGAAIGHGTALELSYTRDGDNEITATDEGVLYSFAGRTIVNEVPAP